MLQSSHLLPLISDDSFVIRSSALRHATFFHARDLKTTHAVVRTIQKHGWEAAYEFPHQITDLPIDESTARWAIAEIDNWSSEGTATESMPFHLSRWISRAPLGIAELLLEEGGETEADLPSFSGVGSEKPLSPKQVVDIRKRWNARNLSACLEEFENFFEHCSRQDSFPHEFVQQFEFLLHDISCRFPVGQLPLAEWIGKTEPLFFSPETDDSPDIWRTGAALILIGKTAYPDGIPLLLRCLEEDWDWWNELVQKSFTEINRPECLDAIFHGFPDRPWYQRLFLTGALEEIRFTGYDDCIRQLLKTEEDEQIRLYLAKSFLGYGTPGHLSLPLSVLQEQEGNPEVDDLKESFCLAHSVMNEVAPEFNRLVRDYWEELDEKFNRQRKRMEQMKSLFVPTTPKVNVGRNDPCPCGSGKKFKKCCLGKN